MKNSLCFLGLFMLLVTKIYAQPQPPLYKAQDGLQSFDDGWKFHLGSARSTERDFNYGKVVVFSKSGEARGTCIDPWFNDQNWTKVHLPHDWAVSMPFHFQKDEDLDSHGYKTVGPLFPDSSIGWYRKAFRLLSSDSAQRWVLRFDGIFRDSKVWVNGYYIGGNLSGYTDAVYDITDFLNFHGNNVVVVRVDASQYEGWFYEGAGIYRHTWIESMGKIHLRSLGGLFVRTIPGSEGHVNVKVEAALENDSTADHETEVSLTLKDRQGLPVLPSQTRMIAIKAGEKKTLNFDFDLHNPRLWNLNDPYLYRCEVQIKNGQTVSETRQVRFGVRTFSFDSKKGFFLNGHSLKIKGVCCHQDHAGVGTAVPDYLWYYRLDKLRDLGVNALRMSHNPPSPELLDACDSLGVLVMDETRLLNSGQEYEKQFRQLILRDRNHASVFIWSIGNEEYMTQATTIGRKIAEHQVQLQKILDPSRTSTYACNMGNVFHGVNEKIPVRGFNYNLKGLDDYHAQHPSQPIIGTEVASTVSTRGIFQKDTVRCYVPDYDSIYPAWASTAEYWWKIADARPWFMGGFVWTGFDYRGEPTPFSWPNINSHFGILDMCGFPKTVAFYYQSWWSGKDVIHIAPHWNWKQGDTVLVWVNSNAEKVKLLLNGKSLGTKVMLRDGHLTWRVPYHAGRLEAIGYRDGRKFSTSVTTTGVPYKIVLKPSKANMDNNAGDAMVVDISVQDEKGREVPDCGNLIHFRLKGPCEILGVGNGDPSSHEADQCLEGHWQRSLFQGKAQLILGRPTASGTFQLEAYADGLNPVVLESFVR